MTALTTTENATGATALVSVLGSGGRLQIAGDRMCGWRLLLFAQLNVSCRGLNIGWDRDA